MRWTNYCKRRTRELERRKGSDCLYMDELRSFLTFSTFLICYSLIYRKLLSLNPDNLSCLIAYYHTHTYNKPLISIRLYSLYFRFYIFSSFYHNIFITWMTHFRFINSNVYYSSSYLVIFVIISQYKLIKCLFRHIYNYVSPLNQLFLFFFNYLLLLQLPHLNINMYSSQRNSKTKQLTKNKQIKTQKTKLTQPKPKKKKINQKRRQTTTTKRPNN